MKQRREQQEGDELNPDRNLQGACGFDVSFLVDMSGTMAQDLV